MRQQKDNEQRADNRQLEDVVRHRELVREESSKHFRETYERSENSDRLTVTHPWPASESCGWCCLTLALQCSVWCSQHLLGQTLLCAHLVPSLLALFVGIEDLPSTSIEEYQISRRDVRHRWTLARWILNVSLREVSLCKRLFNLTTVMSHRCELWAQNLWKVCKRQHNQNRLTKCACVAACTGAPLCARQCASQGPQGSDCGVTRK